MDSSTFDIITFCHVIITDVTVYFKIKFVLVIEAVFLCLRTYI